jgi:callose synthase
MMLYQRALKLLAELERPSYLPPGLSLSSLDTLSSQLVCKFSYVVACQVYGQQKKNGDRQAADIDALLMAHPNLRVAYIDSTHVNTSDELGNPIVKNDFYSVLVKAVPDSNGNFNQIREVYRVKLPGNPIVGEGKPENQNHSIIFTRGEYLQTIDMNQENYIEEAFKLKNLLQEFDQNEQPSIVGYREHIFTGSLSSIANYMALQEGSFVTQGQRVLANPLAMRFHYGHPDVFDKLYFVSRGGVSKASRGVNLSEDIFAGFNSMLRGSAAGSSMHEYVQCGKGRDVGLQQLFKFEAKLSQGAAEQTLTRDVYRLAQNLDFFRLLSFYCGGVGFYIGNCLTVWAVFLFLYSKLFLTLFKLDDKIALFSGTQSLSYWFGQVGFMLTLPIFTGLGIERGFYAATVEVLQMLLTGGPLYFTFMIGTKFYYFSQTILVGGSKYRPTGRGTFIRFCSFQLCSI